MHSLSLYHPDCLSIGKMTEEQLKPYTSVTYKWIQDRQLFRNVNKETSIESITLHSSYEEAINTNLPAEIEKHLFNRTFKHLQSTDIYVDIGAGDGKALLEYRKVYPAGASVIGIANTPPGTLEEIKKVDNEDDKFSFYLQDFKKFRIGSLAGKVAVITDIKGAFLYGLDPALMIQKMGEMLKEGGLAFIQTAGNIRIKIPEGYPNLSCLTGEPSMNLLHLWCRRIQGFDYVEREWNEFEKKIYSRPSAESDYDDMNKYWFHEEVLVLRRNNESIKVDHLVCDPQTVKDWERNGKNANRWHPVYTWEVGEQNKAFLSKKKVIFTG